MHVRIFLILILLFCGVTFGSPLLAQNGGQISGIVVDEAGVVLEKASVRLFSITDSTQSRLQLSGKEGEFYFSEVAWGWHAIEITFSGLKKIRVDSLHVRSEKELFSLGNITLKPSTDNQLTEVIIIAEKPLIESKDGNITFNAAESPLAAGATADELLGQIPLVNKDADGKLTVRGKEPRILIDDKPVELNLAQLQELLESMPGSSIEKIEVMQNPPPQYANEQGGVINIIMKKGKVGKTARLNVAAGTRGQVTANTHFTYRKSGLNFSLVAGVNYNKNQGNGSSYRENYFADSTNYFLTKNQYLNKSLRPNFRANIDYTINKFQSVSANVQMNGNDYRNYNETEYRNQNKDFETYRLSNREIRSEGGSMSGQVNASYLTRTKRKGEQLRITAGLNLSGSDGRRRFYQQYLTPTGAATGEDSTQRQITDQANTGWNARLNYDRAVVSDKTSLSMGSFINRNSNEIITDASYLRKSDQTEQALDNLSNNLKFFQTVWNLRMGINHKFSQHNRLSVGVSAEQTAIGFDLRKTSKHVSNSYWTWLPYANFNQNFNDKLNLSLAYRRSIRRPGINELNPTIDFSDPYTIRFGNEKLEASTSDNFDLVVGRTRAKAYFNLGMGYNKVRDIYSRVRTLLEDGKTQVTWENISGRQEYEVSTWSGVTITNRWKLNVSAGYTYNKYSKFDIAVNKYRNGGSFTSNMNTSVIPNDRWNFTTGITFNRFSNPQGFGRWTTGMNFGVQHKIMKKRLILTVNAIDPFVQNRNFSKTYGPRFYLENNSINRTRNFRLTIGYNLINPKPAKMKS